MTATRRRRPELPPTGGLPLVFGDYVRPPALPFREALGRWPGLPDPICACSGTAALVVALTALRRRAPDRDVVILPAYTCPLVVLAARLVSGLRVSVCDTLPLSTDFDLERLNHVCDRRTLAVVPTHMGGRVADVPAALAVAGRHGAFVLEDAAQALGAFAPSGASVGLEGDAAFFSLAAGKGLTTYEGGLLVSRDAALRAELAAAARETLKPDLFWTLRRNLELFGYGVLYNPSGLRLAYGAPLRKKLSQGRELEALGDVFTLEDIPLHSLDRLRLRVAANALGRLPAHLDQGRERARQRYARLAGLKGVSVLGDRPGADGTWPFFMLIMPDKKRRDNALQRLWREGLGVSKLFARALPDYDFLAPVLGDGSGASDCPNARELADRMLTVSNTHWLDDETFDRIAGELERVL